jgi:DNA-binding transcriptional LysR family regulator
MKLNQFRDVVAIAERGSLRAAARHLQLAQPALTRSVQELERELGAPLFDRSARTATLTTAGKAALEHARAALAAADDTRAAVDEVTGLLRGRARVGMVVGCTVDPFFAALASFHHAHPGVELSLTEGASDRMLDDVRTGSLDLALVGVAGDVPDGLGAAVLVREPVVALVPPDDVLATGASVALADLAARPVVCMPAGTGIRGALDRAAAAAGAVVRVAVEASAAGAVAELAARGLGVAVLSASMGESLPAVRDGRLVALAIVDARVPGVLAAVWREPEGPVVRSLAKEMRHAFGGGA